MSELRDLVIDAHGGKKRWDEISSLHIDMSGTGLLWGMKGWHDVLKDVGVEIDTKKQMVRYRRFTDPRESCIYRPDHAAIEALEGLTLQVAATLEPHFKTIQSKPNGTSWILPISAVTRSGITSMHRSSSCSPVWKLQKSNRGMSRAKSAAG